jgi:hypothetical protein
VKKKSTTPKNIKKQLQQYEERIQEDRVMNNKKNLTGERRNERV